MENHKCKLRVREFGNGKALGGHMRSHVMNLCGRSRTEQQISEETEKQRDDEKQKNREISFGATTRGDDSVVLQDGESETEFPIEKLRSTPRCRRSKRIRKSRVSNYNTRKFPICNEKMATESPPASSISYTSPDEDVAYCLMLLSKDNWSKGGGDDEEEEYQNSDETKTRNKYRCESCNKVFRSYQALGGHRASHKKIKLSNSNVVENRKNENAGDANTNTEKIHECPICYRVFSSGQALGGHKRSHFTASATSFSVLDCSASTSTAINVDEKQGLSRTGENLIDLNLPAPVDDNDDSVRNSIY